MLITEQLVYIGCHTVAAFNRTTIGSACYVQIKTDKDACADGDSAAGSLMRGRRPNAATHPDAALIARCRCSAGHDAPHSTPAR